MINYGVGSNSNTVYCDIDGTLIIWPGGKGGSTKIAKREKLSPKINNIVVDILKSEKSKGSTIILWSAGGKEHCKWSAEFCGITNIVDVYLRKPNIFIDDNHKWISNKRRTYINQDGLIL